MLRRPPRSDSDLGGVVPAEYLSVLNKCYFDSLAGRGDGRAHSRHAAAHDDEVEMPFVPVRLEAASAGCAARASFRSKHPGRSRSSSVEWRRSAFKTRQVVQCQAVFAGRQLYGSARLPVPFPSRTSPKVVSSGCPSSKIRKIPGDGFSDQQEIQLRVRT